MGGGLVLQDSFLDFYEALVARKETRESLESIGKRFGYTKTQTSNINFRAIFFSKTKPILYEKIMSAVRLWIENPHEIELDRQQFCEKYGISCGHLASGVTHLTYLNEIERLKRNRMNFIKVPSIQHQPEVVEKKNDLEIAISKGIKVIIAPDIDSMKIIKIIELLKDL